MKALPMTELFKQKHVEYVQNLNSQMSQDSYEYWLSEHLRLNGIYWGVVALATMNNLTALPEDEVVDFVLSCWDSKSGGFGAFPRHDGHIHSTLSAIQVLSIYDRLDDPKVVDKKPAIVKFIKGLQLENGSFQGDRFGEVDTRFIYTAISALSILGELTEEISVPAVEFILQCYNFDGGFGMVPGAESHAAQVFTCLATLAITKQLDRIKPEKTAAWLSDRQVEGGGLNGRPEKLPDSCYSWWVMSSLSILGKSHWVDFTGLVSFILKCQDPNGGISDRAENETDVYHTCFGLAGLSLIEMSRKSNEFGLVPIDPVYCMPTSVTSKFTNYTQQ
ncbi:Geranylgeranyl transferase type-2 subunit beta [Meyerozyma sp. JA9]|nr:Geranylgeranyl transferase type-2 subunit beta [Meyerozyma sp. JA9]